MYTDMISFSPYDTDVITSLLTKVGEGVSGDDARVMSFDTLYALLLDEEKKIIERIITIDPTVYGFRGQCFGIASVPDDLVALVGQEYCIRGIKKLLQTQYLPAHAHQAYLRMNDAMDVGIGRRVLVESGYRSPAYQAIVFLRYLAEHAYSFEETIKRIAIPGYSEHGYPNKQGMDFRVRETIFDFDNEDRPVPFGNTIEYAWLLEHANDFHLYLSYPEGNSYGIIPEPWHWRYEGGLI